jgi:hypothetical protein
MEFLKSFYVTTNNTYYAKIIFTLNDIIASDNGDFKLLDSKNLVNTLMESRSDRRRTRRNKRTKTKDTEFKYYFAPGIDQTLDEHAEIILSYKDIKFKITINKIYNDPLGAEGSVILPHQLKIYYQEEEHIKMMLDYSNKIFYEKYLDDDLSDYNTITMWIYEEHYWENHGKKTKRDINSVYIPKKLKQEIIKDFEMFESAEYIKRLNNLGIMRKKVLMIEGPPGTGKSSLILALASKLEKDIAYFSFTPDINDTKLIKSISNTPDNSIIVYEDIDCLFQERKVNDNSKNSITFSALLNCLDGLVCKDGAIIICTTNHLDKLDPALTRSGRVDKVISLTYMKKPEVFEMFKRFMENDYEEESEKHFYDKIKTLDIQITPSLLQQYLFKYLDKRQEALDNYLEIKDLYDKVNKSDKGLYS